MVLGVRLLDGGGFDNVAALLDDVELDKAVVAGALVLDGVQLFLVQAVDVPDVPKPGVEEAEVLGGHGGLDAAAAVVAADDNVLDLEVLDGVVEHRGDVEVDVAHQIGDVAVHEGLAGLEARDLLGGDARVAAADPQVLGLLARAEFGEEVWVLGLLLGRPLGVVLEHTVVRLLQVPGDLLVRHDAPEVTFGGGGCDEVGREGLTAGPGVRAAVTLLKAAADSAVEIDVEVEILSKPHRGRGGGNEASAWSRELCEVGAHTSSYHRKGCLGHVSGLCLSSHVGEKGDNRGKNKKKALRLEKSLSLAYAR